MGQNEDLYDESEAEEALSLCDLPLGGDWDDLSDSREYDHPRSTDLEEELFEFFNDLNSEMRLAEDIIFCGKLLPCSSPALSNYSSKNEKESDDRRFDFTTESFFHCRSDSLSESQRSDQSNVKGRFMRSYFSLDYRKLKSTTSPAKEKDRIRIPAGESLGEGDFPVQKAPVSSSPARSKWNLLMFGLLKSPTDMKLRDIRNRQIRRNPLSMFPSIDCGEQVTVKRGRGKGSYWRGLLRALGCKGHVRAPFGCIPHV